MKIYSDIKSNTPAAYILGYGGTYYTAWHRGAQQVTVNWWESTRYVTYFHYQCRLSKDLDKAKRIMAEKYGEFEIDLSLVGEKWDIAPAEKIPATHFPFGRECMKPIAESTEVWQLLRLYQSFDGMPDHKYYEHGQNAKARLIEMKELIMYKRQLVTPDRKKEMQEAAKREKLEARIEGLSKGYFGYAQGEKVTLELELLKRFSFEGHFGTCTIMIFSDQDGRQFKYMGGSPPAWKKPMTSWPIGGKQTMRFSVKHGSYQGNSEVLIQRAKAIK